MAKSLEKQTEAINKLVNLQLFPIQQQQQAPIQQQHEGQPPQPNHFHQTTSASDNVSISQNYFKNTLRSKILVLCPDFFKNSEKTWLAVTKSHVDEIFQLKSIIFNIFLKANLMNIENNVIALMLFK